jgi:N utilization substance protein B
MASSRHLSRVIVIQTIFAYEFNPSSASGQVVDPEAILEYVSREFEGKISDLSFAYQLLNGVLKNENKIRDLIIKYAPQWPIDKIAPIDRAVLELGAFEMLFSKDVPAIVAMDEAIELSKTFGNENSQKFINGVLNAILAAKGSSSGTRKKDSRKIQK